MWNIIIQCVSDDFLKTKIERVELHEKPDESDIKYYEKFYSDVYDPYSPNKYGWDATVVNVFYVPELDSDD